MTVFQFQTTGVFRVSGRAWLVVTGRVLQGETRAGAVLRDVDTGETFELMGIDMACPRPRRASHDIGLLVDPAVELVAAPGRIWTASDPDEGL